MIGHVNDMAEGASPVVERAVRVESLSAEGDRFGDGDSVSASIEQAVRTPRP